MMAWRNPDSRVRGCFRYHGASTGRWASLGIQLHNLKKPMAEGMGAAIDAVKTGDLAHLKSLYPDNPLSVVGDVARAALCARPGCRFIDADFSGIESRVLAWLSGQQSKLDQWSQFDRTGIPEDEPYYILGLSFGLPRDQVRDKGKTGDLAFGCMGAIGAYRKFAPDDPASDGEIRRYQKTWRDVNSLKACRKRRATSSCGDSGTVP
jgi:DNA polymerase bacteriophage-type